MLQENSTFFFAPIGIFTIACGLLAVIVLVCYSCLHSRKDWRRIDEVKKNFKLYIEEVKKNTIELSVIIGEMQELLLHGENISEKESEVLKSRVGVRIGVIEKVAREDFRIVDVFMREVEAGTALKSLSSSNIENFKRDMRQKQWLMACLKDNIISLASGYKQLGKIKDHVQAKGEDTEGESPICELRKSLQEIMKQISTYEMGESMKRQEEILCYNRYNHQPYYASRHSYNCYSRNANPAFYHSFQSSSSAPSVATYQVRAGKGISANIQAIDPWNSLSKPGAR